MAQRFSTYSSLQSLNFKRVQEELNHEAKEKKGHREYQRIRTGVLCILNRKNRFAYSYSSLSCSKNSVLSIYTIMINQGFIEAQITKAFTCVEFHEHITSKSITPFCHSINSLMVHSSSIDAGERR